LKSILKALNEIGKETPVILPLHPRTKKMMEVYRLFPLTQRIKLIDPVSYFDMLKLEMHAKAILTDSGGVQKEAYWFNVPCFTLREETEWVETVQQGWNRLVGTDIKIIVETVSHFKGKRFPRIRPAMFGNGKASEKIVQNTVKHFGLEG
jgi:UDP-N-acetylglucosamine 2-epimerase